MDYNVRVQHNFSSSISANLGNSMVEIHWPHYDLWLPHFRTFCELVEGEENKLTTFSTWTIMLGCNESNIMFSSSISANLGNSGQTMVEIHWPHSMIYGRHTFVLFVS